MSEHTNIAWTDHTFNPWIGCTEVSPACDHCYARELAERYGWAAWGQGQPRHRTAPSNWRQPYKWDRQAAAEGRRHRVFCASLADVFDAEVPPEWRADLWQVIRATPHLDWQLLTKRPNLIHRYLPDDWGSGWSNVWLGTTVESPSYYWRIRHLVKVPAAVRFLSCEPLLEPLGSVNWWLGRGVQWVIVGGESGSGWRPMDWAWVRSIRDQCTDAGVAFFLKQGAGPRPGQNAVLDGRLHQEFPRVAVKA